jgi:endonuclease G
MRQKLTYTLITLLILVACKEEGKTQHKTYQTASAIEMPRRANQASEQIIENIAFTISYNLDWNIPNWIAYTLTCAETTGKVKREKSFYPDPRIKHNPVQSKDYSHSGYDRGHMAPAADMKWSEQAMLESFYTTNICPQNQSLNRCDWNDLEEMARDWAKKYDSIHIACGPIVSDFRDVIGTERQIVVPEAFYKVFLRQKPNGEWTSIGFVMPNTATNQPMMTYMMSVDEVENLAEIDFFYQLPDEIEEKVESDYNISDWTV